MPESLSLTKTSVKLIPSQTLVHAAVSNKFINDFNRNLDCTDVIRQLHILIKLNPRIVKTKTSGCEPGRKY